jgi:hypothetical protein
VLAPPAPAMRLAVARVAYSGLGAVRRLTPPAPAMSDAVLSAAICDLLSAALLQARPPAHYTPPGSLHVGCRRNPTPTAARHSQPPPTPSQSSTIHWCTPDTTNTTVAGREQVRRWVQHVSVKMVNSAWAGDVRWVCSRAGWTGTPPRPPPPGSQAACASCPNPDGGSDTPHSTPLHGVHSTTEEHLGVYLLF